MISIKEYVEIEKSRLNDIVKNNSNKFYLDIFQIGDNSASNSYIKGKLKDCDEIGIIGRLHKFEESITQEELEKEVFNCLVDTNGVIIQLPVPKHIDANEIISMYVSPELDVDGFVYNTHNPCTPKGIIDLLKRSDIDITGKECVVVGRSNIVGKPLAKMFTDRNATVTLCHSHTNRKHLEYYCREADIIVSAVGKPKWLNVYTLNNPIVIDVGINRDENGKLCGDVDYDGMKPHCEYITPVPGGVGLLTRLSLMKNVIF